MQLLLRVLGPQHQGRGGGALVHEDCEDPEEDAGGEEGRLHEPSEGKGKQDNYYSLRPPLLVSRKVTRLGAVRESFVFQRLRIVLLFGSEKEGLENPEKRH